MPFGWPWKIAHWPELLHLLHLSEDRSFKGKSGYLWEIQLRWESFYLCHLGLALLEDAKWLNPKCCTGMKLCATPVKKFLLIDVTWFLIKNSTNARGPKKQRLWEELCWQAVIGKTRECAYQQYSQFIMCQKNCMKKKLLKTIIVQWVKIANFSLAHIALWQTDCPLMWSQWVACIGKALLTRILLPCMMWNIDKGSRGCSVFRKGFRKLNSSVMSDCTLQ